MLRAFFVLAFVLVNIPFSASANSCLQDASNQEIIGELRYRLNSGTGGGSGSISATFLCGNNATLSVNAVNLSTGETSNFGMATGDWTTCRNTENLLTTKLSNKSIQNGAIFAVCVTNATLKKVLISPSVGVKLVDSIATGDWTTCRNSAEKINSALTP